MRKESPEPGEHAVIERLVTQGMAGQRVDTHSVLIGHPGRNSVSSGRRHGATTAYTPLQAAGRPATPAGKMLLPGTLRHRSGYSYFRKAVIHRRSNKPNFIGGIA